MRRKLERVVAVQTFKFRFAHPNVAIIVVFSIQNFFTSILRNLSDFSGTSLLWRMKEDLLQNDLLHMIQNDMLENNRTLQMLLTTELDLKYISNHICCISFVMKLHYFTSWFYFRVDRSDRMSGNLHFSCKRKCWGFAINFNHNFVIFQPLKLSIN